MARLDRLASDVGIAEQPLLGGLGVAVAQADDDDMDVRRAARLAAPAERPVRERDLQPEAIEQDGPELRDLLALADRIGRDEADPNPASRRVFSSESSDATV